MQLTAAESQWLQQHPRIRVGVNPDYPPFDFIDDRGTFSGLSSDYLDLIAKRLGVAFTVVPNLEWHDAIAAARDGRVDVVVGVKELEDRRQFLNMTPDYLTFPIVILMREAHPVITGLADLRGKTVALGDNATPTAEIARRYPDIKRRLYPTLAGALVAVQQGEADATVLNIGSASYLMAKYRIGGLVIAAPAGLEDVRSAFGVRSDWPELTAIIGKTLDSITPDEQATIRATWITAPYDAVEATRQAHRIVTQVAGGAVVVMLCVLLWNYRLKRQARERRRAAEIIAAKEAELRDMFARSPVSVLIASLDGALIYANSSWLKLMRIAADELAGHQAQEFYFDPADRERLMKDLAGARRKRDPQARKRNEFSQMTAQMVRAVLQRGSGNRSQIKWLGD